MPATRKLVRDVIRGALADATHGFNAKIAAIAASYGIAAFTINWGAADSPNFIQSQLDTVSEGVSRLTGIRVALYTGGSQTLPAEDRSKGAKYEGEIEAHLDVWVEFGGGADVTDDLTEPYADAIEDAVIEVLNPQSPLRAAWQGPVYFDGTMAAIRNPVVPLEDGYQQYLSFTFIFEVSV
jgi:hypothetical protein